MRTHLFRSFLARLALFLSPVRHWRRPQKIAPQQLQTLLSQGESPLVLDVRNLEEFVGERGHIEAAVLSPLPELHNKIEELKAHRMRPIVTV